MAFLAVIILQIVLCMSHITGTFSSCFSPHYLEFGKKGIVDCDVGQDFQHVYWQDLETSATMIRLDEQEDGKVARSGQGYLNGDYNVTSDGDLVIHNVTNVMDKHFKVGVIGTSIIEYNVTVISTITVQEFPSVIGCENKQYCYVCSFKEGDTLTCSFDAKPAVTLSWYQVLPESDLNINQSHRLTQSKRGIAEHSACDVSPLPESSLMVMTCVASGNAIGSGERKSTVIIDNTNLSDGKFAIDSTFTQITALINSRKELKCSGKGSSWTFLWKIENGTDSDMIMFAQNDEVLFPIDTLSTMAFSDDGSLTLNNVSVFSEGNYTCLSSDGTQTISTTFSLTAIVIPSPPQVVVSNCPLRSSECTIVSRSNTTHTISCSVTGVYPKVELKFRGLNSDILLIDEVMIVKKRGEVYDITRNVEIQLAPSFSGSTSFTCFAVGVTSEAFNARTVVKFIDGNTGRSSGTSTSPNSTIISTTVVVSIIVLLILLVSFVVCMRRKKSSGDPVLDALQKCEAKVNELLDCNVQQTENLFKENDINELRSVASEILDQLKRRNLGQIGGAAAGIAGGAMGIAGALLAPFTLGMSLGLMAAGTGVGLAGAGINVGFSLEHDIKNKNRIKKVKPTIDQFISFHNHFARAAILTHDIHRSVCVKIDKWKVSRQPGNPINKVLIKSIKKITREIDDICECNLEMSFEDKISSIVNCAKMLANCIDELMKLTNANPEGVELQEPINASNDVSTDTPDRLATSLPHWPVREYGYRTFRTFLLEYLKVPRAPDISVDEQNDRMNARFAQEAHANVMGQGCAAFARAGVAIACDVGDDVARAASSALRVVGVASGIVLGAVGLAFDAVFLDHALDDLRYIREFEKNPEAVPEDGPLRLYGALIGLTTAMEEINKILQNAPDH